MTALIYFGANRAMTEEGAVIPNAKRFVLKAGTDQLASLYEDANLTLTMQNPSVADDNGEFPFCHVMEGTYDIIVKNQTGNDIYRLDGVELQTPVLIPNENGFSTLEELYADVTLGYVQSTSRRQVRSGDIVTVAGTLRFQVMEPDSSTYQVITSGGVKLLRTDQMSLSATVGTGADYATLNEALEALATQRRSYASGGVSASVTLVSGFTLTEEIHLLNGQDFSWVQINAEDAVVGINRAAISTPVNTYDLPDYRALPNRPAAFFAYNNSHLPTFNCRFSFDETGGDYGLVGCLVSRNSTANWLPESGITNAWPTASLFSGIVNLGAGWSDVGNGRYDCNGTQTANTLISEDISDNRFEVGTEYVITLRVEVTSGALNRIDTAGVRLYPSISATGKYQFRVTAAEADGNIFFRVNPDFIGTVSEIRVAPASAHDARALNASHGSFVTGWGSIWDQSDLGVRVSNGASANLRTGRAIGCRRAINMGGTSTLAMQDADFSFSIEHCIRAQASTQTYATASLFRYSGAGGNGLQFASVRLDEAAVALISGGDVCDCGMAIFVSDDARCTALDLMVHNNNGPIIQAENGGTVTISGALEQQDGLGLAASKGGTIKARDMTITGASILAERGGTVTIAGVSSISDAVNSALQATTGGTIVADDLSVINCQNHGAEAVGGQIFLTNASITASNGSDLAVSQGGEIRAHGVQTTQGATALADMNVVPNAWNSNGIILCDAVTKMSGQFTLDTGASSVTVAHGLPAAPLPSSVQVGFSSNPDVATAIWPSSIDATDITFSVSAAPGIPVNVSWQAAL